MRLVVTKADSERILSCCGRQPVVGACIDFADEYEPAFDIFCPVCDRCVTGPSFRDLRRDWNSSVIRDFPDPMLGGVICEGST